MDKLISILLVDDDPKNLMVLETILNSPEYRLVNASTADEALLALMNEEFAAIVLDVQMPDMSGLDLARLIKQRKKTQHVPILFLTAYYQEDEHVVLGYGAGAVDYITKPVNPAVLRSKIGVFIDLFRKTTALAEVNRAMEAEMAERQQAEERFRMVVETAPNAMVMIAADGQIILVNSRTESLFGYDRDELICQSISVLIAEDGLHDFETSRVPRELIGKRKNGTTIPLEVGLSQFQSSDGIFKLASFVDITERKRAEAALRAANAELEAKNAELRRQAEDRVRRMRAEAAKAEADAARERSSFLAEASSVLASSFDYGEMFTGLAQLLIPNFADCCIVDLVQEDGTLKPLVVAHKDKALEQQINEFRRAFPARLEDGRGVAAALKGGIPVLCKQFGEKQMAAFARSPEEEAALRPLEIQSYIVVAMRARGRTLGGLCFASMTERRYNDADLSLAIELAERAGMALDNSRLYAESKQAREAAEAANTAKDRFLAMLSHELRTPLSPVLHATTLLEEADCPEPMRSTIATIRRNVQLEARLIDDLLDLARIRNGKLQLQPEPVDAHDLLARAVDICRPDIETRQLQLTVDLHAKRHSLEADPARIQQIFWNLISNAVKYTPPGGAISLRTEDDERTGSLRVEFTDSGIGIESARLESIFDAFEQANSGRSGGLGLGLAICRALVTLHGGRIEARSGGASRGSLFVVTLPTVREVQPSQQVTSATPVQAAPKGLRVLLVEDHVDTAATLQRLLVNSGYVVQTATDVASALRHVEEGEFDLLVSDIGLPDGSGLELMPKFVAAAGNRPIAGIALSGFGMPEDLERSFSAGFNEHLIKPVDFAMLRKALGRISVKIPPPVPALA
ncbi:multi-sensor hybrid histidine kinase [Chthoniobacter flavus Ellin428]|uniref:histidine kinase n=1 Tax=Chthoniobacter flavus Ellin428 TaxID=497964 RepID=B4CZ63_9BACT|nr:response regulator [Chthoniobacter flavus]EDY20754.1 multi-sensor hybrid histidine kinase [Chthoniobacter flavus Ellin428]TCO89649.1 PAS domain S-box-containing protein [Chthoniobacter flavus]